MIHLMARKALRVELSREEQAVLDEWLEASSENRLLLERVKTFRDADAILRLERKGYGREMAARVARELDGAKRNGLRGRWLKWAGSAAAVLLVAVSVALWLWREPDVPLLPRMEMAEQIVPGKVEAVLTFADGETLHITDTTDAERWKERLCAVVTGGDTASLAVHEVEYNRLTVPAGGEFFYVLSDSTKVWINSGSELRFPVEFEGGERRVELRGEAFFDVAHDRRHPFVVALSEGDITVYGTRFNVSDYEDADLSAVLVEGSIGFRSAGGDSVRLAPSERMVYGGEKSGISVEEVDTELYTAWIERRFVFRNQTLEEIMATLSRWYDFEVTFADDAARSVRLSGRLNRYDDIRVLLRTYEEVGGVRFDIQGKTIIVRLN